MPNLWEMFEASATRFADRTAVEIQRRDTVDRFSYGQLEAMALERALWLSRQGVTAGDRCAILADNDAHWCAAYLGILRLGAIVVPLDTNYSAAQVATIVKDSGAKILFVNERLRAVAEQASVDCLVTGLAGAKVSGDGETSPKPAESSGEGGPAVILYTSGTTADPKGVVLTHANLIAERDGAFAVVDVNEHDAVLGVLPLFHSLAQLANLLLPFAVGARVVYLETVNSTELLRALSEREITVFACVPQFFYLIHQRVMKEVEKAGWLTRSIFRVLLALNFGLRRVGVNVGPVFFGRVHGVLGKKMRLMVTGGSKFDPAIGHDLYALGFTILQAYGLTETSGAATINKQDEAHIDTVGRPFPGVEIRIEPPESEDVDGEIAIRGGIVTPGYYNRPDATTSVMRDGWFLTGDLGRLDAAGRLTITGRKKEMIVLSSGKNIYPEEIEAHYRKSAFIKEIAVMGLATPDHPMTERLHAVVVPDLDLLRERKIVNAGDLLRFEIEGLAVGLPPHKRVLGYDIWFEPLPRTTTGKVKRHEVEKRLKAQHREATQAVDTPLPDADREWLQESKAALAVEVIQPRLRPGARIRPDANLELDLGMDSMERVELLTALEQKFGVRVSKETASSIFTVRQLVDALRSAAAGAASEVEESWAVLLRDLPSERDPLLSGLLQPKPIALPLLFLLTRVFRVGFTRVRVSGLEHLPQNGAFLICPNHQSFLDPVFVGSVLPYRVFKNLFSVGAVEYFETPFTMWVARTVNCVPVDPDSNLVPAMQAGAFGLTHGKTLVLFPEGERSIDGSVKKFKKGGPILARHLQVPIVPVALTGVFELWPRNRAFNWSVVWPWSGHRITVAFGEPMRFGGDESYSDGARRLQARVAEMVTSSTTRK